MDDQTLRGPGGSTVRLTRRNGEAAGSSTKPILDFSLVIPVFNDPLGIRRTLQTALQQRNVPRRHEIIVVDNRSTDRTRAVVREFVRRHPRRVRLLREESIQSQYAALNRGIRRSRGRVLALSDANVRLPSNWIASGLRRLESADAGYVGGRVVVHDDSTGGPSFWSRHNQIFDFAVGRNLRRSHFAQTCALFVRRELFEHVGLFDPRLVSGWDVEFGQRVHEAGYKQVYLERNPVYHPARSSLRANLKRAFRVGRGHAQRNRYMDHRYPSRSPVDPRNLMPPHPGRFRDRLREAPGPAQPSCLETVGLYGIAYLQKLAWYTGVVYERVQRNRNSGGAEALVLRGERTTANSTVGNDPTKQGRNSRDNHTHPHR